MSKNLIIQSIASKRGVDLQKFTAGMMYEDLSHTTSRLLWFSWAGEGSLNVEINTLRAAAKVLGVKLIDLL